MTVTFFYTRGRKDLGIKKTAFNTRRLTADHGCSRSGITGQHWLESLTVKQTNDCQGRHVRFSHWSHTESKSTTVFLNDDLLALWFWRWSQCVVRWSCMALLSEGQVAKVDSETNKQTSESLRRELLVYRFQSFWWSIDHAQRSINTPHLNRQGTT